MLNPEPSALAAPSCLATDQRGISRPQGLACDIGAVEMLNGPGSVGFSVSNISVNEQDGSVSFAVIRNGTVGTVTVDVATQDGSAITGVDYTATATTLSFAQEIPRKPPPFHCWMMTSCKATLPLLFL